MPVAHRDAWTTRLLLCFVISSLAITASGSRAKGDRITIRGGGHLKGKLVPDKEHPGQSLFIGEVGKNPMVFKKEQILQVVEEKSPLDDYVGRLAEDRTTPASEFELGVWCEENKLADLAQLHYEQTVKRDSTFELAHKKLGHVLMGGRWLNPEEVKEAQGLVKYKGRWMTPEERDRRELLVTTAAEGNAWVKRLRLLREGYIAGPISRSKDAEQKLLAIDDSKAVGPVLKVFGDDSIPVLRSLGSRILGSIPGPEASSGLVSRLLFEEDETVRQMTLNEIVRRDSSEIIPILTKALRAGQHQVVNRAAWGLGHLNASVSVPKLVTALVTFEYEIVMVDSGATGSGVSFNAVSPASGPGFGNYTGRSIPILTPPTVGPGVVAFGATSVPFTSGASISSGDGSSRGPVPRMIQIEHHNDEVLATLVKLTGRDFGYDIPTWKQWVATSFKVEATPTRRVLEP